MATADDLANRWRRGWDNVTNAGVVEAWTMTAGHLMERVPIAAVNLGDGDLNTDVGLARALSAMQILDEWHAPIGNDLSGVQLPANPDQERRLVRLFDEARFNNNVERGSLIPKYARGWRHMHEDRIRALIEREYDEIEGDAADVPSIRSFLLNTAHLPPTIKASPDGGEGEARDVQVLYHLITGDGGTSKSTGPLRVAVAPILEAASEVELQLTGDKTGYLVVPSNLSARLEVVVKQAIEQEAHLLLLPEMVLPEAGLARLSELIEEGTGRYAQENGRPASLVWILAGVSVPDRDPPENYVAVLDASGTEVSRQHKFSRWNLSEDEQKRFALLGNNEAGPERLVEAIDTAADAIILDLPGLGRVSVLICADIDVSEPGDWLYSNGGLDLVYAPIMDRSRTPQRVRGEEDREQWVVKRALRAAQLTRAAVVVTNSMALTEVNNRTNLERGLPFPPIEECHVGLMLNGMPAELAVQIVTCDLSARDVIEVRDWEAGWEDYFPPPAPAA